MKKLCTLYRNKLEFLKNNQNKEFIKIDKKENTIPNSHIVLKK